MARTLRTLLISALATATALGLVVWFVSRGDEAEEPDLLEAAKAQYEQTARLNPHYAAAAFFRRDLDLSAPGALQRAVGELDAAILSDPQNAISYFHRGLAHADQGQLDRAVDDFSRALTLDATYAAAHYHRSLAHADLGAMEQSVADYDRFLALNPNYAETHSPWETALGLDESQDSGTAGAADLKDALRYSGRGEVYSTQGRYDLAISQFDEAIRIYSAAYKRWQAAANYDATEAIAPEYAKARHGRGLAHSGLGEHTEAIRDLGVAIILDPSRTDSHRDRGMAFEARGDLRRALYDYTAAIELDPDNGEAYYLRGCSRAQMGNLELAVEDYDQTIVLGREGPVVYVRRADALVALAHGWERMSEGQWLRLGGRQTAIQLQARAGELTARRLSLGERGRGTRVRMRRQDSREVVYRAELEWLSSSGEVMVRFPAATPPPALDILLFFSGARAELADRLGSIEMDSGLLERAVSDYGQAMRLGAPDAETYYKRGLSNSMLGKREEAIADFSAAIELQPVNSVLYVSRGEAYTRLGNIQGASRDFARAVELRAAAE